MFYMNYLSLNKEQVYNGWLYFELCCKKTRLLRRENEERNRRNRTSCSFNSDVYKYNEMNGEQEHGRNE